MSVLELNLRAKKTLVEKPIPKPIPTIAPPGFLQLEVGKKYVLNCGAVIGPMIQPKSHHHMSKLLCSSLEVDVAGLYAGSIYCWDIDGGIFTGTVPESPKSIRREWHPTWREEEAWMAGKRFEYYHKPSKVWLTLGHSYKSVCDAFGKDSKTTKEWWCKNMAPIFMQNQVREKV